MMNTTHGMVGLSIATIAMVYWPAFAVVAAIAILVGSIFPDLDLVIGEHRRSLHFPVLGWIAVGPTLAAAVLSPLEVTVAVAFFVLGVAIHSTMDIMGGGPEMRPWLVHSDRAVYAHYPGRWFRPRRWIRYDGAPEDFVFGVIAAIPALLVYDGWIRRFVLAALLASLLYTVFRKQIPDLSKQLLS
jgi:hypothetical protein